MSARSPMSFRRFRSPRAGAARPSRLVRLAGPGAVLAALLALAACGGDAAPTPSGPSGGTGSSHNAGRNCLDCHGFTAAGTAYAADGTTPAPGAVIRLATGPEGQGIMATLSSDGSGNFYTNQSLALASGLHVDAARAGGTPRSMQDPITSGGCNAGGCHAAGNRIRVD